VGQYTRQRLVRWGIGNNQISEVVPARNTEVEIFDAPSLDSTDQPGVIAPSRLIRAGVCLPNVSGGFDNKMSSVRIRSSAVQFSDNFNSGSLANWVMEVGTWEVQNGKMVPTSGFDPVAYIGPNRTFDGPIVLDVDVQMVTGNARMLFHSNGEKFGREYLVRSGRGAARPSNIETGGNFSGTRMGGRPDSLRPIDIPEMWTAMPHRHFPSPTIVTSPSEG
jgi:hypothetical protein